MRKIFILTFFLFVFLFLFAGKSQALTIYACSNYYAYPYTENFVAWYHYNIASGSASGHYVLNNCWSGSKYGDLYKGEIGNSTLITGHYLGSNCDSGTCDSAQTDDYTGFAQDDKFFIAVYDGAEYTAFRNFFTGNGVVEAPSDKWSMKYYWFGTGGYFFDETTNFGTTQDENLFITLINSAGDLVKNSPPLSYFVDIYDAWNFGEIATDTSQNLSLNFDQFGFGQASISFNQTGIGIKDNFQDLFDFACYIATGIAIFFMIKNFFEA